MMDEKFLSFLSAITELECLWWAQFPQDPHYRGDAYEWRQVRRGVNGEACKELVIATEMLKVLGAQLHAYGEALGPQYPSAYTATVSTFFKNQFPSAVVSVFPQQESWPLKQRSIQGSHTLHEFEVAAYTVIYFFKRSKEAYTRLYDTFPKGSPDEPIVMAGHDIDKVRVTHLGNQIHQLYL